MTDALLIAILATINVIVLSYAMYGSRSRGRNKYVLHEAESKLFAEERKVKAVVLRLNELENILATKPLTFAKLAHMNWRRSAVAFPNCDDWDSSDWMLALMGELGEAANMLKKRLREDKEAPELQEVGYELADAVTYIDLLATHLGLNLGELVREKYNIISKRVGYDEFRL